MGTGAPDTADSGPEVGETTANGAEDAGREGGDTREAAAVPEAAAIKFALEAEVTPAFEEVDLDTGSSADNSTTEDTEGYCHDDSVLDSIKNADRAIEHDRDPGLVEDDLPAPSLGHLGHFLNFRYFSKMLTPPYPNLINFRHF